MAKGRANITIHQSRHQQGSLGSIHRLRPGDGERYAEAYRGGTSKPCASFCLAKSGSSTDPTHCPIQTRLLLLQSANGSKNTE
jgi:hypothetical protein